MSFRIKSFFYHCLRWAAKMMDGKSPGRYSIIVVRSTASIEDKIFHSTFFEKYFCWLTYCLKIAFLICINFLNHGQYISHCFNLNVITVESILMVYNIFLEGRAEIMIFIALSMENLVAKALLISKIVSFVEMKSGSRQLLVSDCWKWKFWPFYVSEGKLHDTRGLLAWQMSVFIASLRKLNLATRQPRII